MKVVTIAAQVQRNLEYLESARLAGKTAPHYAHYVELISRGRCFVAYDVAGRLHFAPSRFVGYKDVTFERHNWDQELDGKVTNPAITKALGVPLVSDQKIDMAFEQFLVEILGYNRAPFNIRRKYWLTDDVIESITEVAECAEVDNSNLSETEKETLALARIGQGAFRRALIKRWRACAVTGCSRIGVLRASHIKPWSKSTNMERLDPNNGLLLTPNLDSLFDRGLITFKDDGTLVRSDTLGKVESTHLIPERTRKVKFSTSQFVYLAYHREHVFIGNWA
ncbi:MAG: HNH endonuclease [Lysobacterales bacterium]